MTCVAPTSPPHALRPRLALLLGLLAASSATLAASPDDAMRKLAQASGCMTCHHIDPGAKGPDGLPPIGPAWRDVAAKYKGQKGADAKLTQAVMAGSNPYESHWKGKVSGLAMPPNAVAIQQADAQKLVKWILTLGPAKQP